MPRGRGLRGGTRGRGRSDVGSSVSTSRDEVPSMPSHDTVVGETSEIPNSSQGTPASSHGIPSPATSDSAIFQAQGACPIVYIIHNRLLPETTSGQIAKIFQKLMCPVGYNWKNVPDDKKEKYFEEFKKVYTWAEIDEVPIRNVFMKQAATRYRDMVSSWKSEWFKNKKKPGCISEEYWETWLVYWNKPETIAKAQKNSKNRMTEVEAGKGPSKHTRGSKSTIGHMLAMQKERGGVMPTLFEIQKRTHMHKDGIYVDERSMRIGLEVERRIADASIEGDSSIVDQDKIYLEVVGGVKRQHVYGISSLSSAYVSDGRICTSQGSSSSVDAIMTQLEAEWAEFK